MFVEPKQLQEQQEREKMLQQEQQAKDESQRLQELVPTLQQEVQLLRQELESAAAQRDQYVRLHSEEKARAHTEEHRLRAEVEKLKKESAEKYHGDAVVGICILVALVVAMLAGCAGALKCASEHRQSASAFDRLDGRVFSPAFRA